LCQQALQEGIAASVEVDRDGGEKIPLETAKMMKTA
jgi:hypothetical protein